MSEKATSSKLVLLVPLGTQSTHRGLYDILENYYLDALLIWDSLSEDHVF